MDADVETSTKTCGSFRCKVFSSDCCSYETRRKEDVEIVSNYIDGILEHINDNTSVDEIRKNAGIEGQEYVERFCRSRETIIFVDIQAYECHRFPDILDCRVVRTRSMTEELSLPLPENCKGAAN